MAWLYAIAAALAGALLLCSPARAAEEVVELGGFNGRALLNKPAGKPRVGLVLLTGGDGYVGIGADGSVARAGNWIIRTRAAYARRGIASLAVDGGVDVGRAIAYMRQIAPKVVVVAMSRGSLKVEPSLAHRPDGVVLASSMLPDVKAAVGDPSRLPPTLIVHHRLDTCRVTLADDVEPFAAWAGRRARVVWIDGGTSSGPVCQARAYHGFIGREGQVVGTIASFASALR